MHTKKFSYLVQDCFIERKEQNLVPPARIRKATIAYINLKPATTDVGGVTPEHLCDHIAACFGCGGHAKVIHNARTEASDVTIPEVVDDLREVDVLCQRPGHVLSHARWVVELARASLPALLVEDPREAAHALARVVDHRALVGPDLSHLGKL